MVMHDDKPFRGFFIGKQYENGHMLTGNRGMQETVYRFKPSPIDQKVLFGARKKGGKRNE